MKEIRSFLAVLSFIVIGSSLIFFQFDDESTTYADRLLFVYGLIYASFDTTGFSLSQIIYLIVVTVLLSVILLNLLIALMTDTYQRIEDSAALTDGIERVYMILETVVMKRAYSRTVNLFRGKRQRPDKHKENSFKGYLFSVEKVTSTVEKDTNGDWDGRVNAMRKIVSTEMQKNYEPIQKRLTDIEEELTKHEDGLCIFKRDVECQIDNLSDQVAQILEGIGKMTKTKVKVLKRADQLEN